MRVAALLLAAALAAAPAPGRTQDTQDQLPESPPVEPPPAEAPAPAPPAPPPPAWVARDNADLVLLDKVAARTRALSLQVGQSASFGTLTVTARACEVRPPDVPADATAWLDITDSTPGAPAFHGWMIESDPAASSLQHPTYDVRLAGCH